MSTVTAVLAATDAAVTGLRHGAGIVHVHNTRMITMDHTVNRHALPCARHTGMRTRQHAAGSANTQQ